MKKIVIAAAAAAAALDMATLEPAKAERLVDRHEALHTIRVLGIAPMARIMACEPKYFLGGAYAPWSIRRDAVEREVIIHLRAHGIEIVERETSLIISAANLSVHSRQGLLGGLRNWEAKMVKLLAMKGSRE